MTQSSTTVSRPFLAVALTLSLVGLTGVAVGGYSYYISSKFCGIINESVGDSSNDEVAPVEYRAMADKLRSKAKWIVLDPELRKALLLLADDMDDVAELQEGMRTGTANLFTAIAAQKMLGTSIERNSKAIESACVGYSTGIWA